MITVTLIGPDNVRSLVSIRNLRSSEGLAGRMAANAFGEFWPDLKKYFFHKRNQAAQQRLKNAE